MPAGPEPNSVSDWIVVLSEDNWEICDNKRLLALGRGAEQRLNRMADGDRVWVYVNRKYVDRQTPRVQRLRAMARVTGPVRHLASSPWKPRGKFRFDTARPIRVERRCDLPALDLLKQMSFAGRPPKWAVRLLGAPVRLTEADVALFRSALTRPRNSSG